MVFDQILYKPWLREAQQSCALLQQKKVFDLFLYKAWFVFFPYGKKIAKRNNLYTKKGHRPFFLKLCCNKKWSLTTFYIKHSFFFHKEKFKQSPTICCFYKRKQKIKTFTKSNNIDYICLHRILHFQWLFIFDVFTLSIRTS